MTTVGCFDTKAISGFEHKSMIPTATITAIIMTERCWTMPTAVITLSSEKTASSTTI
ncbi:hypothetical protein D3C87_2189480 [compost metagenome]